MKSVSCFSVFLLQEVEMRSHCSDRSISPTFRVVFSLCSYLLCYHFVNGNPDAKRLYDDLLYQNDYNVLIRPVENHRNNLTVHINLKLSALVDVVSIF